jgi:hypothetical protein
VSGERQKPKVGRCLWVAVLIVLVVPGRPAARGMDDDLGASYGQRIAYIDDWGHQYPGYIPGSELPLDGLGLAAGIMQQTLWQKDSGREHQPIWHLVNAGLSIQPYRLAIEYQRDGDLDCQHGAFVSRNPTRDPGHAPLTRADVCGAWRTYFIVSDAVRDRQVGSDPLAQSIAQRCLWDAHTQSIAHELWQHEAKLRDDVVPELERRFWANWVGTVFVLADMVYPTTATLTSFFSSLLMPDCSPLGAPGCQLDRFSGTQHTFLATLTAQERSIQSLIDEYVRRRERGDPPCTVVDPSR